MSSPRLLVLAAVALGCAAFPAPGSAALTQDGATNPTPIGYGVDGSGNSLWTADGVLSPGETVNVNFPLRDTQNPAPYANDATGILYPQGQAGNFLTVVPGGPNPFTSNGGVVQGSSNYSITVSSNLQCGTRVPLRLAVSGPTMPAGSQDFMYGLPTGAAGAYHRTASTDVGNIILDGQTKESTVAVAQGTSMAKGIRVHIDQIDHQYSTFWMKLTLVSPSGKEAVLINQVGNLAQGGGTANRQFKNVTFSMDAVGGEEPMDAADAATEDFTDTVITPKDSFSIFDGEPLTGTWKLKVTDISAPLESRRLRSGQGRTTLTAGQMAEVGNWQLDTAGAICGTAPTVASTGPDAWFGADPIFIDPDGGSLDASASTDPSFGGSIASYQWDLDGSASTGAEGFETTVSTPTVPLAGPLPQGKRTVRLRVVDDSGKVSAIVARDVFISKVPVISSITANPTLIMAGTPVTLTAAATDPDLPNGQVLKYEWDLDDDGFFDDATGESTPKTWPQSGLQIVRVKVTDQVGAYAIKNQVINVSNMKPTAAFSVLTSPLIAGDEANFTGAASTDVDGTIVKYEWDFDGDGEADVTSVPGNSTPAAATAKWTFPEAGEYSISLKVTDNTGGFDQLDSNVVVTGRPVPAGTATPTSPLKNELVSFNAAGSHDSDAGGSIVKYEWDLDGNGSFEISGATAVTATKSYPNAGTIVARLRVTDNVGATATQLIAITVRNPDVTPTPTPTPTPTTPKPTTPGPGNNGPGNVPDTGPGGEPTPDPLKEVPKGVDPTEIGNLLDDPPPGVVIGDGGVTEDGFAAKIAASSKAKAKKVYKKGIAVKLVTNDAATVALKVVVTPKDAKTMGLKIKKNTAIGSGKLVTKGAGTGKFVVKFSSKYQRYVKKAKKTKVTFRAVVKSGTSGSELVVARNVVLVK